MIHKLDCKKSLGAWRDIVSESYLEAGTLKFWVVDGRFEGIRKTTAFQEGQRRVEEKLFM